MRQFDELFRSIIFAPDHFTALGVERTASAAEVRKAYLRTIRKVHADLNRREGEEDR